MDFIVPGEYSVKIKEKVKRYIFGPSHGIEKDMEHESNGDTTYNWYARKGSERLGKETSQIPAKSI